MIWRESGLSSLCGWKWRLCTVPDWHSLVFVWEPTETMWLPVVKKPGTGGFCFWRTLCPYGDISLIETGSAFLKITFKYSILNITRYIVTLERYKVVFARYSHILRCVVILCNIKSPNHWWYVINNIKLKYTVVLNYSYPW